MLLVDCHESCGGCAKVAINFGTLSASFTEGSTQPRNICAKYAVCVPYSWKCKSTVIIVSLSAGECRHPIIHGHVPEVNVHVFFMHLLTVSCNFSQRFCDSKTRVYMYNVQQKPTFGMLFRWRKRRSAGPFFVPTTLRLQAKRYYYNDNCTYCLCGLLICVSLATDSMIHTVYA